MVPGSVIYRGPSELDGAPIVVIATLRSNNHKTGNLVQTWIMREDIPPSAAAKSGADFSICGDCKHRQCDLNTCYVLPHRAPSGVWYRHQWKAGYPEGWPNMYMRAVRIGSYGDPAAVPIDVWDRLTDNGTVPFTGYTHQWRWATRLQKYCQASVDTLAEAEEAWALGWKTYRCRAVGEPLVYNEIQCPGALGENACIYCGLCDGKECNVSTEVHGLRYKVDKFQKFATIEKENDEQESP